MKKLFAILAVSAFVFAACGNKAETEATEDTTAVVTEEVVEAPVQDTTAQAVDTTAAAETTEATPAQ